MIEAPQITHRPEQQVALIHVTVPRAGIKDAMDEGTEELAAVLHQQGIMPTGPWLTHHLQRPIENFDFELCFPIPQPVTPSGRVRTATLAARTVVKTTYRGDYSGLPAAWGEFQRWIEAHGYVSAPDLIETYTVNPASSPNPQTWQTTLERPILAQPATPESHA